MDYAFDRFLKYDEMRSWLEGQAAAHPELMTLESYGRSNEGRDLLVATITDTSTGAHDTKPAHWVDANIHSIEVTSGVAALYLIHYLLTSTDEETKRALATRTFYIAPRVNPDGVEWALADSPVFRRSSTRRWPYREDVDTPGLVAKDIDGDGRVLTMRIPDPNGWWTPSKKDPRIMAPVPPNGVPEGTPRYRLLTEGRLSGHDGFTMPTPRPAEGLDLNRNFPAGWGTGTPGSGDHPLSEPEIDQLVRAVRARPNVCGYNAFHTSGGVLLRPSSTQADSDLLPGDVWTWKEFGKVGTALTGYPVASVFEDFTWDKSQTMAGAADDWAYEHLGLFGWTTEFWDVVRQATGETQGGDFWYLGPDEDQEIAVLKWVDENEPELFVDWYSYDHPELGQIELGGFDGFRVWSNAPESRLVDEVKQHAPFAVYQALAAPCLEIPHTRAERLSDELVRVEVGVANTGWLPTDISAYARKNTLCLPAAVSLTGENGEAVEVVGGPARVEVGQLEGRRAGRFSGQNDGTPDRVLAQFTVRARAGQRLTVRATHERAGTALATLEV